MADDMKSKIANLEKELYQKDFKPHPVDEMMHSKAASAPDSWDTSREEAFFSKQTAQKMQHHKTMKKFVKGSIIFFIFAVGVAGIVWWRGANIISGENIAIDIVSPVAVAGGEPFETKVTTTNRNKVAIEEATLFFEYPSGFYSVADKTALPRTSKNLGRIAPGQSITEITNTILYGEENVEKIVSVILEYRMAGSSATLKKNITYSTRVTSSPVTIKIEMLKEAFVGQEVEFSVIAVSNSKSSLEGLLLEVSYPFGFTFVSADPAPLYGTNEWKIDNLAPQEKRTIKIRGIIEGQDGEEKITNVSIGTQSLKDERETDVIYSLSSESLTITKPFIGLDLVVNGSRSSEYAASFGRDIRVDVIWQSNNPTTITDGVIEVFLKGDALNRYSIYAGNGGFYQSSNDSIIWEKSTNTDLATIEPGARGSLNFNFSPVTLGIEASRIIKNPQITIEARVRARRISDANVPENVATFATRKVKFNSDFRLTAQSLYFSGPFKNIGPLPPKVEAETTYTIKWIVRNSSNGVSNASVKTTLPLYVKWLASIEPIGEDISFNDAESEVLWNVGRIPAGGSREAAFQISFSPSLSQLFKVPYLTGDSYLVGTDDFTKANLQDRKTAVTTSLSYDPQFSQTEAAVVQ